MTVWKGMSPEVRVPATQDTAGIATSLTEDAGAGARSKLVDFIVHLAFYPVLMADRAGPDKAMVEHVQATARAEIDRFRGYSSAEEVIDGFGRGLRSKLAQGVQPELRLLHLPVIDDLRDDFERKARELGFGLDTLLTSLCSSPKGDVTMDQERVSERAYALEERAGQPDGAHDQHWQQACREIEAEDGATMTDTMPVARTIPATAIHQPGKADDQGRASHPKTTARS